MLAFTAKAEREFFVGYLFFAIFLPTHRIRHPIPPSIVLPVIKLKGVVELRYDDEQSAPLASSKGIGSRGGLGFWRRSLERGTEWQGWRALDLSPRSLRRDTVGPKVGDRPTSSPGTGSAREHARVQGSQMLISLAGQHARNRNGGQ